MLILPFPAEIFPLQLCAVSQCFSPAALIKLALFIYLFTAFRDASLGPTLTGIHWAELNRKWRARFVLIWVKQTFLFPLPFKLTCSDVILPKYLCVLKSWKKHHQRVQRISRYALLRLDILYHLSHGDSSVREKINKSLPRETGWHIPRCF